MRPSGSYEKENELGSKLNKVPRTYGDESSSAGLVNGTVGTSRGGWDRTSRSRRRRGF